MVFFICCFVVFLIGFHLVERTKENSQEWYFSENNTKYYIVSYVIAFSLGSVMVSILKMNYLNIYKVIERESDFVYTLYMIFVTFFLFKWIKVALRRQEELQYYANYNLKLFRDTDDEMQKIKNQVVLDSVMQYRIAKRQGDAIQTCVQAGLVAAAYLQAHDEINYRRWKEIEKFDQKKSGHIW